MERGQQVGFVGLNVEGLNVDPPRVEQSRGASARECCKKYALLWCAVPVAFVALLFFIILVFVAAIASETAICPGGMLFIKFGFVYSIRTGLTYVLAACSRDVRSLVRSAYSNMRAP